MNQPPPDGPEPMGRTATRIFVVALLLITLALAIWSAFFLIQMARESGESPAAPDTTTASVFVPYHSLFSDTPSSA